MGEYVLMWQYMPIGKGTKQECEAMIERLRVGKENHPAFETKRFGILTMDEYESLTNK